MQNRQVFYKMIEGYFQFRGQQQTAYKVNIILEKTDVTNQEKLEELLQLDFLKQQVGPNGNFKLVEFLNQKENLQQLVKYSVGVPENPDNKDESYK